VVFLVQEEMRVKYTKEDFVSKKITPNLWFDGNAKEAVDFYLSVFPDSKIIEISYYPDEGLLSFQKDMAGKELVVEFELNGNRFMAINAGPEFKFSEAISFMITCEDQEEIDYYWEKLSSNPESEQCGWCKDKYGLSWQVVPNNMGQLMNSPNSYGNLMKMKKIVIADL